MSKIVKNSKRATKRRETVYILDFHANKIKTKTEIEKDFCKAPEEFRWDFCNSVDEYIYRMELYGNMLTMQKNEYIEYGKILTPKQYGQLYKLDIPADITMQQFIKIVNKCNCRTYPINEYNEIVQCRYNVVVVKFKDGIARFVDTRR